MLFTIKRIGISSAAKVGAFVNALSFAVFGLFIGLFQASIVGLLSNSFINSSRYANQYPAAGGSLLGAGLAGICIFYFAGIVLSLIAGGIAGAIVATLYNVVAHFFGGLEVNLGRNTDQGVV